IITGITAILAFYFFPPKGEWKDVGAIQGIVTRVIVVSIGYYSILWCGKNYKANRHLYIVTKHRQHPHDRFETFIQSATDEGRKNAVLLETTRCIFKPSVTGFLGGEDENPNNRIVEVLKTFGSGAAKP